MLSFSVVDNKCQLCARVSGPILNPVPNSVHFMDYLNFGALFDFFLWSICWKLCNLALVICLLMFTLFRIHPCDGANIYCDLYRKKPPEGIK